MTPQSHKQYALSRTLRDGQGTPPALELATVAQAMAGKIATEERVRCGTEVPADAWPILLEWQGTRAKECALRRTVLVARNHFKEDTGSLDRWETYLLAQRAIDALLFAYARLLARLWRAGVLSPDSWCDLSTFGEP